MTACEAMAHHGAANTKLIANMPAMLRLAAIFTGLEIAR